MKVFRKVSLSLICMILLVATLWPVPALANQPNQDNPTIGLPWRGEVTLSSPANRLNVREQPGTNHSVLATLPHNHQLHIIGRRDNWWRVHYDATAHFGYVSPDFVSLPAHSTQWVFIVVVTPSSGVNFRQSAPSGSILGVASNGQRVPRRTTTVTQSFRNVVYRGLGAGWMHQDFLRNAP